MRIYSDIGILSGSVLIPSPSVDLTTWSVIACDQFTSQPEYWKEVEKIVGNSPSTLRLVLPEAYLGSRNESERLLSIKNTAYSYLDQDLFHEFDGMIYVEREYAGNLRRGIVLSLDLEQYGFTPHSSALIRASEETVMNRLPPRVRIREVSPLESTHTLVLLDDQSSTVIEPLQNLKSQMQQLYNFELMLGSGRITGYGINNIKIEKQVIEALRKLADPGQFSQKYSLESGRKPVLFAVGDGNHSLASAKVFWDSIKQTAEPNHPARYALVEIVNLHDPGLRIEPIHRLISGVHPEQFVNQMLSGNKNCWFEPVAGFIDMKNHIEKNASGSGKIGLISSGFYGVLNLMPSPSSIVIETIQNIIDHLLYTDSQTHIDYIHDADAIHTLARQPGHLGFFLPAITKADIFPTILTKGILPRKAFSMGDSRGKRFYLECRKINSVDGFSEFST